MHIYSPSHAQGDVIAFNEESLKAPSLWHDGIPYRRSQCSCVELLYPEFTLASVTHNDSCTYTERFKVLIHVQQEQRSTYLDPDHEKKPR